MEGSQILLAAHGGVISHHDYSDVYTLQMEMSTCFHPPIFMSICGYTVA